MASDDSGENMDTDKSGSSSEREGSPSNNYQSPLLPPCRVCGEKASGFHYGANTCEACKGFFRRSLQRKSEYKCVGSGTCQIQPGKRNACAKCRYQKCLSIGMSKDAIKTGRYTHEKKAKDISEVKRLQMIRQMQDQGQEIENIDIRDIRDISMNSPCWSPMSSTGYSSPSSPDTVIESTQELDAIIQRITQVYLQQTPHTPDFFSKLPEKERSFLEKRQLQLQMFGTMKPIPKDEYKKIYETTGIDVDGRREMITHMIPCIEKAIRRFIAFAKALPGFKDLPIDDQIALIKAGRFDNWVLESHQCFNVELKLYTPLLTDTPCHIDDVEHFHEYDWLRNLLKKVDDIQKLNLTQEETIIARGFAIMFPDRCELKQAETVAAIQQTLMDCLLYLFEKNHPEDPYMFVKLILILTECRTLSGLHQGQVEQNMLDYSDVEISPLLREIATLS